MRVIVLVESRSTVESRLLMGVWKWARGGWKKRGRKKEERGVDEVVLVKTYVHCVWQCVFLDVRFVSLAGG